MPLARQQAAVIPYRIRKARLEVALVTKSRGKGWIVPKGSVDEGEHSRDAAIREAHEEAGLRGVVTQRPIGGYRLVNRHGTCRVEVYVMRVTQVRDRWDEDDRRRRRWMKAHEAADCVREELKALIHHLASSLRRL